jgi:predicted DNA-binding transcriptional regulator AlpA
MKQKLMIVSEYFLEQINEKQDKIICLLNDGKQVSQSDFITENQAKEILQKKTTWFWQMRKNGMLPFRKIGKSIYYSKTEINQLLENSK